MTSQTETLPAAEGGSPPAEGGAWLARALSAPAAKLAMLLALMLAMQIPLSMVDGVVEERQERQQSVQEQFRAGWGPAQTLLGPLLVVPYDVPGDPATRRAARRGAIQIAPARLSVAAKLAPQTRRKGFFTANVFGADVDVAASFQVPALAPPEANAQLLWGDAFMMMSANDLRGMAGDAAMVVNGRSLPVDAAPDWLACGGLQTVIARLSLSGPPAADARFSFAQTLSLRGTESFRVAPLGRETRVTLSAPWPTPGFSGDAPPVSYTVTDRDFVANWQIAGSAVEGRRVWTSGEGANCLQATQAAQPGVDLLDAVPTYRMVARASKYANLFLALAFLTYFLFETISGARIHVVQYGLLGLSISLFALLLVSFGEPLGFAAAYAISTGMVMAQACLFTRSVVRRTGLTIAFGGVLASLFGFLYVVLSLETYSLLMGAVAVFAALSLVMAVSRRIRWSAALPPN